MERWSGMKIVAEFEQSLKKYPPIAPAHRIRTHHRNDRVNQFWPNQK